MKRIFEKIEAECAVCKTPVDGRRKRGDRYYCETHYLKTSSSEKQENTKIEREYKEHLKLYQ